MIPIIKIYEKISVEKRKKQVTNSINDGEHDVEMGR
jgi:hypothetical protein